MESDFQKKIKEQFEFIVEKRGKILSSTIGLESVISAIITNRFVMKKEHSSFLRDVTPKLSFSAKIEIIKKMDNEKYLKKYRKLFDKLNKIRIIRNMFAHNDPFFSEDASFIKGSKIINVEQKYNKFYEYYSYCLRELMKIWKEIIKSNGKSTPNNPPPTKRIKGKERML